MRVSQKAYDALLDVLEAAADVFVESEGDFVDIVERLHALRRVTVKASEMDLDEMADENGTEG